MDRNKNENARLKKNDQIKNTHTHIFVLEFDFFFNERIAECIKLKVNSMEINERVYLYLYILLLEKNAKILVGNISS